MFNFDQIVIHVGNRMNYRITALPNDDVLLENCGEPFYEYEDIHGGQRWIRRQSEMEDGRFIAA